MNIFLESQKRAAFDAGVKAKKRGWSRESPYYEDWVADIFFRAGYDGEKYADDLHHVKKPS